MQGAWASTKERAAEAADTARGQFEGAKQSAKVRGREPVRSRSPQSERTYVRSLVLVGSRRGAMWSVLSAEIAWGKAEQSFTSPSQGCVVRLSTGWLIMTASLVPLALLQEAFEGTKADVERATEGATVSSTLNCG